MKKNTPNPQGASPGLSTGPDQATGSAARIVELLLILMLGYLVFLLIRTCLLEYYRIPSKSMEPTLHGDPANGDLVLVNKAAFWFRERPEPLEMVVVRPRPGSSTQLVKRVAAVGPSRLQIKDGDLFVGPLDGVLQRLQKDPAADRHMRVPVFRATGQSLAAEVRRWFHLPRTAQDLPSALQLSAAAGSSEAAWQLLAEPRKRGRLEFDGRIPGHLSTRRPVDTSYLEPDGTRQLKDRGFYPDIGMELLLTPEPGCVALQLVYEHRGVRWGIELPTTASPIRLTRDGAAPRVLPPGPGLSPNQPTRVAFGYLDGRLFVTVEDTLVLCEVTQLQPVREDGRENLLHAAAVGSGGCQIAGVCVFHDVHYTPHSGVGTLGGRPYPIEEGRMFLLGDNTLDSQDSRELGTFALSQLVGSPLMTLSPAGRRRLLR